MEQKRNCRNCGAPVNDRGDCEYCGTRGRRKETASIEMSRSGIVITADRIRFWCGDQQEDENEEE